MAEVIVRVPAALRQVSGGTSAIPVCVPTAPVPRAPVTPAPVPGLVTVGAVLDAVSATHPALARRIRDEVGRVRVHVNLFVGADNIRDLDGLDTPIRPGEELTIIAAVSGG